MLDNLELNGQELFNVAMQEIGRLESVTLKQQTIINQLKQIIVENDKQIQQLHNELSIHDKLLTKGDDKIESTKSNTEHRQASNKLAKSGAKTK